jgi:hypothetical protein
MEAWKNFYRPYFDNERQLIDFIEVCEGLEPDDIRHRAKIMMHQGQRLISLSENVEKLEIDRDPLKLLFLLVCAEAIAKLHADYKEDGQSPKFVRCFFHTFCSDEEKSSLLKGIVLCDSKPDLDKVIGALYLVRCDVVHEGLYWGFSFATAGYRSMITGRGRDGQVLRITITYNELKKIVCNGVIRATRQIAGI